MSIETFCLKNKVPYNIFSKWYKDTRKKVVEVQVDGIPSETAPSSVKDTEALHYLNHFWDELFAYLDDGELPIDNNLAERCIRKLTTQRNSMLHFGSDEGVEMAATYHSIISTVKLHGKSAWNFLGTFFKKIFNGCRDFFCLTRGNIEMAVCH